MRGGCSVCGRRQEVGCKGCTNMETPFWGGKCDVFPCAVLATMGAEEGYDPAPKIERCRKWAAE